MNIVSRGTLKVFSIIFMILVPSGLQADWEDFHLDFERYGGDIGQSLGVADSNWVDAPIFNQGSLIYGAPNAPDPPYGNVVICNYDTDGKLDQSCRSFGALDAGIYYFEGSFRKMDTEAEACIKLQPGSQAGTDCLEFGINSGQLAIIPMGNPKVPVEERIYFLDENEVQNGVWYDVRVVYTVVEAGNDDTIEGWYKQSDSSTWIQGINSLGRTKVALTTDLDTDQENTIITSCRSTVAIGNGMLDNAGGTLKWVCYPPLVGDLNGDCFVRFDDLAIMSANWLESHLIDVNQLPWDPQIYDVEHFTTHYNMDWYCGHPRQTVYRYYGNGEIVAGHNHAPCAYQVSQDVSHSDIDGYISRSAIILQRSYDYSATWPETEDVVLFDQTMSDDDKRAFIYQPGAPRENYDMFSPDSLFYFARTRIHDENERIVCFALRSPDRGRTWESVPTVFEHPYGPNHGLLKDCHPVVRMPDGQTLLSAMSLKDDAEGVALYKSTDNGLSWDYQQHIAGPTENGRFTYAGLLLLPSGELQLYTLHIGTGQVNGTINAICMRSSIDGGQTWDEIRPIVSLATQAAWGASSPPPDRVYRSPWAMILNDGRMLVVFARRYHAPRGFGGIISRDGGQTWSNEFVIRDDGISDDLGYPVGAQMEDGRIVITYYFTVNDGNGFGGTRAILGSRFRVD